MKKTKERRALESAIKVAGSPTAFGRLIGVSKQAIFGWQKAGYVPYDRVLDVESLTGISKYDLAPKVCGTPPSGWKEQLDEIRAAIVKAKSADAAALWGE